MNSKTVARYIAQEWHRDAPEEWLNELDQESKASLWAEDKHAVLEALTSTRRNLLDLKRAEYEAQSVESTVREFSGADLFDRVTDGALWRLRANGLRDGFDFRIWTYRRQSETLTFLVVRRRSDVTSLELSD